MEIFHNEFFFDHVRKKLPRKFRLCCWEGGSEKHTVCPCPEERGKKKVLVTLKNMEWPFSSEKGSGIWQRFLFVWVFTVMGKKKAKLQTLWSCSQLLLGLKLPTGLGEPSPVPRTVTEKKIPLSFSHAKGWWKERHPYSDTNAARHQLVVEERLVMLFGHVAWE